MLDTKSRGERGWRIAVAAFVVVLVAMAGAAVVFLALAADVMRDEVVLRQHDDANGRGGGPRRRFRCPRPGVVR